MLDSAGLIFKMHYLHHLGILIFQKQILNTLTFQTHNLEMQFSKMRTYHILNWTVLCFWIQS